MPTDGAPLSVFVGASSFNSSTSHAFLCSGFWMSKTQGVSFFARNSGSWPPLDFFASFLLTRWADSNSRMTTLSISLRRLTMGDLAGSCSIFRCARFAQKPLRSIAEKRRHVRENRCSSRSMSLSKKFWPCASSAIAEKIRCVT